MTSRLFNYFANVLHLCSKLCIRVDHDLTNTWRIIKCTVQVHFSWHNFRSVNHHTCTEWTFAMCELKFISTWIIIHSFIIICMFLTCAFPKLPSMMEMVFQLFWYLWHFGTEYTQLVQADLIIRFRRTYSKWTNDYIIKFWAIFYPALLVWNWERSVCLQ